MPTPQGDITSTETWSEPVVPEVVPEEVVEDSTTKEEVEDDLPELS
jgi:hypothetical protein